MSLLRLSDNLVTKYMGNGSVYYPDFIIYAMKEQDYCTFWQNIKGVELSSLYTDGINVRKATWFQYYFERLKGFFGFENYCDPVKIEFTLAKTAFYGYIRGFDNSVISNTLISKDYTDAIKSMRSNENSRFIHEQLIDHYSKFYQKISYDAKEVYKGYEFGNFFLDEGFAILVPSLDPQHNDIITKTIEKIDKSPTKVHDLDICQTSSFAVSYVKNLILKKNYSEALKWSSRVEQDYQSEYIDFYLGQNNYPKAVGLLEQFYIVNRGKALDYVTNRMPKSAQIEYLKVGTDLTKAVARYYYQEALNSKKSSVFLKMLVNIVYGTDLISSLSHALKLDPQLLKSTHDFDELLLKEEWYVHQFKEAISYKRFDDAMKLYKEHPNFKYSESTLQTYRNYLIDQLNINAKQINLHLKNRNLIEAEQLASKNLGIVDALPKSEESKNSHKNVHLDYAFVLLRMDQFTNEDLEKANIDQLDLAEKHIIEYKPLNEHDIKILNAILIRKINALTEHCRFKKDASELKNQFLINTADYRSRLKNNLLGYIELNKSSEDSEIKKQVAKMYFVLADIFYFLESDKNSALRSFEKAYEFNPDNPYYKLFYYEITEHDQLSKARDAVEKLGDRSLEKFESWKVERWNQKPNTFKGFNIHYFKPPEQNSLFSFSFSTDY